MKVTNEMVDKAVVAYEESAGGLGLSTDGTMRLVLETALGNYEREHSRWERFSQPEISVITAAMSTLDTNGAPAEKIEYAQRLVSETRAVLGNEAIPKANRWDAFSDEELGEINAGASERAKVLSRPEEFRQRAEEIYNETVLELRRRKGGYQGPGVYEVSSGREFEVLGRQGENGAIVLRSVGDTSGFLYFATWNDFNYRGSDCMPFYRYLRPLGESS